MQKKNKKEKIHAPQCSEEHYLQQPTRRNNSSAHQQTMGLRCGIYIYGVCIFIYIDYYSVTKKNEILPFSATQMHLENITLSKTREKTNIKLYPLYIESKKKNTNASIHKTETDSLTQKIQLNLLKGKGRGRGIN